jgi:SAM-dependent methyltransferase
MFYADDNPLILCIIIVLMTDNTTIYDYAKKENYVTRDPDPNAWRYHPNYQIIKSYQHLLRGTCGDLGCNHGSCTLLLLDFASDIEHIYGFDVNVNALRVAYENAMKLNPSKQISFMCANLLSLPVSNDTFDFLMSFHTLEHIFPEDADKVVAEIWRILKPGGYFVISIPYDHAYPDPHHVAFYKEDSLRDLFEKRGFFTIHCHKDDRWVEKDLLTALFVKPQK